MKTNWTSVLIGAAVVLAVVYYLKPSAFGAEGFAGEEPAGQKIGGYIALAIFLFVVIGGMIAAFSAGGSK